MVDYSGSRATPRMDLGVAVMEYTEQEHEFIGTDILPIFRTKKQKSVFPAITRESITREADTKRAVRGSYNRDGFSAKDKGYNCEEHGLEGPLDDSERAMYASDFDAELVTVKIVTRRVLQVQEKRIADKLFNPNYFSGSALFTDVSSSPWANPESDVLKQISETKSRVRSNCGMMPNALVLSTTNIERLKRNKAIVDAVKYTARPTDAELKNALADLFGVKHIFEGKAIRNTAREGKAFAGADIWDDRYVLLALVADDANDLSRPGIGRTFLWETDSPENAVVEQYRAEEIRSDVFRVRQYVDENLIDNYFGHLLKVA